MVHLVQIGNGSSRRVAMVEEPYLRCLGEIQSVYELAERCLQSGRGLAEQSIALANGETLDYGVVYSGTSEWRLLAPIDVPGSPSRMMIAGTGLTHLEAPGTGRRCTLPMRRRPMRLRKRPRRL